jgi:hypothetical protein
MNSNDVVAARGSAPGRVGPRRAAHLLPRRQVCCGADAANGRRRLSRGSAIVDRARGSTARVRLATRLECDAPALARQPR